MAIEFACRCGKRMKVADEHAGKRVRCPDCREVITIPTTDTVSAAVKKAGSSIMGSTTDPAPFDTQTEPLSPPASPGQEPMNTVGCFSLILGIASILVGVFAAFGGILLASVSHIYGSSTVGILGPVFYATIGALVGGLGLLVSRLSRQSIVARFSIAGLVVCAASVVITIAAHFLIGRNQQVLPPRVPVVMPTEEPDPELVTAYRVKSAELERRRAEAARRVDDAELRKLAVMVLDPESRHGLRYRIVESMNLGKPGYRSFLLEQTNYNPGPGDPPSPSYRSVLVEDWKVVESAIGGGHHMWRTREPKDIVLFHAAEYGDTTPYEVVRYDVKSPGNLEAIVKDTQTAKLWKFTVSNYSNDTNYKEVEPD